MALGDRIKARREALSLTRPQLAERLGVAPSTVSNYETGISFPKEEIMLRLFDCLETDPNTLFQDSFQGGAQVLSPSEQRLVEQYRALSPAGTVYLFSLNRARADADVVLTAGSGRTLVCFGRVIFHAPPLPGGI